MGKRIIPANIVTRPKKDVNGYASKSEGSTRSDNMEITSKYDFSIKKHHVNALIGYSYLYTVNDGFNAGNGDFPTEAYLYDNLGTGAYLTNEKSSACFNGFL